MPMFFVFFHNAVTREDFSVPTEADTPTDALAMIAENYPRPTYQHLCTFGQNQLQSMLDDAARWPGVASTPQPSLEQLLRRVTAGVGKLPPLPNRAPTQQPATQAAQATDGRVEQQTMPRTVSAKPKSSALAQTTASKPTSPTPYGLNQNRSVIDVLRALRG